MNHVSAVQSRFSGVGSDPTVWLEYAYGDASVDLFRPWYWLEDCSEGEKGSRVSAVKDDIIRDPSSRDLTTYEYLFLATMPSRRDLVKQVKRATRKDLKVAFMYRWDTVSQTVDYFDTSFNEVLTQYARCIGWVYVAKTMPDQIYASDC